MVKGSGIRVSGLGFGAERLEFASRCAVTGSTQPSGSVFRRFKQVTMKAVASVQKFRVEGARTDSVEPCVDGPVVESH